MAVASRLAEWRSARGPRATWPAGRVACVMEYSEHGGSFRLGDIEDEVRKARDDSSPNIAVDNWACVRMIADKFQPFPQCLQKFLAEADALRFIPFESGLDVTFSPGPEYESRGHEARRMRAKTSSSEEPAWGSDSYSANRLSSSSFCQSVSGRDSGNKEILSQIASTSSTRSSNGRARISATSSCFMLKA
jgi:hypothetical protein